MPPFPENIPDETLPASEWSRRSFLQLLGLGALGTAWMFTSCRGPGRTSIPRNDSPEWLVPGLAALYATTWPAPWGGTIPLIATSHEGRPTMLEANDGHPGAAGCPAFATASLWDLYSPDRSKHILYKGNRVAEGESMGPAEFAGAFRAWSKRLKSDAKAAIVVENFDCPTFQSIFFRLQARNPGIRLYRDTSFRRNHSAAVLERHYEAPVRAKIDFAMTDRILSIDCDFLGPDPVGAAGEFFDRRSPDGEFPMNRLYMVESQMSLTGGMADERLPLPGYFAIGVLKNLASELNSLISFPPLKALCSDANTQELYPPEGKEAQWMRKCAEDLARHRGRALILLGDSHGEDLHRIVLILNEALQAYGEASPIHVYPAAFEIPPSLDELDKYILEERLDFLFWFSPGNPMLRQDKAFSFVLHAPLIESVHIGLYADSFARECKWHLPAAHFLESWGDYLDAEGTLSLQQPLILPLYNGTSPLEFLLGLMGDKGRLATANTSRGNLSPAYAAAKATFFKRIQTQDKELSWNAALKQGFQLTSLHLPLQQSKELSLDEASSLGRYLYKTAASGNTGAPSLVCKPDYSVLDGRYINNAWLQECPDPVTKIVWGNAALASPDFITRLDPTGKCNGLRIAPKIKVLMPPMDLPLLAIPGMADNTIVLPLGYGQAITGIVGENCGFPPLPHILPDAVSFEAIMLPPGARATVLSQISPVLVDPSLIRSGNIGNPLPDIKLNDPVHQWGMCIDLSKCIGCNACVLACQAENNIPIVGREQAAANRLMHWLHVDRYFSETADGFYEMLFQPRACQQCENAPCESVCPVNATVHTKEGLNAMTYSRCVGTRYCANNCPYKVRRFNYFDYNRHNPYLPDREEALHLQRNPNVTVRMRGIMEKCTYCVQRIEAAKNRQKRYLNDLRKIKGTPSTETSMDESGLRIPPDSVKCACQAACPAGAITFGNLLDGNKAEVNNVRKSLRAYTLLDHLGVHPRTAYLSRTRNRNQE